MELAGYLYPWDVAGDPAAAERVAGLGLDHVVLAAAYHGTRALTPRHPRHRIVVAEHSAVYYEAEPVRWENSPLRPPAAHWPDGPGAFTTAAGALRSAGVGVHGWAVFDHIDPWPGESGRFCVVNAYGDRYPWALCPARDAVREYAVLLAADLAGLQELAGLELESCGWFGLDHLSGHDKIAGVRLDAATRHLMSLCFCDACRREYRAEGLVPEELVRRVRACLDPVFAGQSPGPFDPETADAVLAMRSRVADRLRREVIATIRAAAPGLAVLLHASPDPTGSTAFTGVDVATTAPLVDGLVLNCWSDLAPLQATARAGARALAGLLAVEGFGGRPGELLPQLRAAARAGAAGARLYHLGLASAADLSAVHTIIPSRDLA